MTFLYQRAAGRRFFLWPKQEVFHGSLGRPLAAVNAPLRGESGKQFVLASDAIGLAQEQIATRPEREREESDDPSLDVRFEVDHNVSATDQIQARKRRFGDQVLHGEDYRFAQLFGDLA